MFGLTPYNRKNNGISRKNDIYDLRTFFDDFFNDSFFPAFARTGNNIRADIRETDKEYVVEAEIPGVKKEDIKLDLRDDVLTISAEHNEQTDEERENYVRRERRYGSYSRSFCVENIKNEEVRAKYENGILTITLPKSTDKIEKSHKIDIQ